MGAPHINLAVLVHTATVHLHSPSRTQPPALGALCSIHKTHALQNGAALDRTKTNTTGTFTAHTYATPPRGSLDDGAVMCVSVKHTFAHAAHTHRQAHTRQRQLLNSLSRLKRSHGTLVPISKTLPLWGQTFFCVTNTKGIVIVKDFFCLLPVGGQGDASQTKMTLGSIDWSSSASLHWP